MSPQILFKGDYFLVGGRGHPSIEKARASQLCKTCFLPLQHSRFAIVRNEGTTGLNKLSPETDL